MYRIKIDPDSAYSLATNLKRCSSNISQIRDSISGLVNSLNWEVKSKYNIEDMASSAFSLGSRLASDLFLLGSYIENAVNRLTEADNKSVNSLGRIYSSFEKYFENKESIQNKNPYFCDWPVPGRDLETSGERRGQFGIKRPGVSTDYPNGHTGIDIWGDEGDHIVSAHSGTVSKVYPSATYGNVVFVDTEIDGIKYQLIYAHLKEKPILSVGENIEAGEIIGIMGHSGSAGGINHLHFEVRLKDVAIDPEGKFFLEMQTKSTEWHKDLKYKQPDFGNSNEANSSAKLK